MKRVHAFSALITQGLLGRLPKLLHVTTAFEYGMSTKRIPVRFRVFFSLIYLFLADSWPHIVLAVNCADGSD